MSRIDHGPPGARMSPAAGRLQLVRPAREHLRSYLGALETGWSPDNLRPEVAAEQIAAIGQDAEAFLASFDDPEAKGPPIGLPDGTTVPRLPSFRRWMWEGGEFCGSIGARWQPGTAALPPHVFGHIGYAVVPWRRREGLATRALALMLEEVRPLGLPHVELTCDADNEASIRVIRANGGEPCGQFDRAAGHGGGVELRWRIPF